MTCVCGHEEDRHTHMHKQTGPCMKCRCSHFSTEDHTTDLPEVSSVDIEKAMADLMETTEELSSS